MKNLRKLAVIAIVAIMLLAVALPTNAAFEGVTFTVTSNVGNGTEVNAGDEIVYTVKVKNTSENNYIAPSILAFAPAQTEIKDIEIDQANANDSKQVESTNASYTGMYLPANSEVNFKVTVKIKENATGEIKFANVSEEDEEADGVVIAILFTDDVTDAELDNFGNVMNNLENYDKVEDVQKALGSKFYFGIIKQDQSNPIKVQKPAEEPTAEEPAKEEPKTEEPVKEEPKAEEPAKEEPKAEEPAKEEQKAEPVKEAKTEEKKEENKNKPTVLPKTGVEYSIFALISAIVALAIGLKLLK